MAIRVGINGFGRIGRCLVRVCLGCEDVEFLAVNDLTDTKTLAHLLKYDSLFGILKEPITIERDAIIVGRRRMRVFSEKDPQAIDWTSCGAQIVIESTGALSDKANAAKTPARHREKGHHLSAGQG